MSKGNSKTQFIIIHNTNLHQWFLDSRANQHMSPLIFFFKDYILFDIPKTSFLKDNSSYKALGYGFILIQISFGQTLIIYDVSYILGITKNLLRVAQITIIGNTIVTFTNAQCILSTVSSTHKKTIITINKEGNIFMLGIGLKPYSQGLVASFSSKLNLDTTKQHHRLNQS
jgi:hypothetical protein